MTTIPALRGESAFIRFPERAIPGVDTIGISEHAQQQLEKACAGNGVILLAGPPDSGKKTLAYALLQKRCGPHSSVAAIERTPSPEVDAVVQYRTKDVIGLDVNALVRAVLRTSSDVLYVEDPADAETLERLCQAAIGPRLVIASFSEATDAIDALAVASATIRPALAARAITTSVGVRLLRLLCNDCKTPDPSDRTGLAAAQAGTIYRAAGCAACNDTGYRGRTAIVQVVPVNENMRSAIVSNGIRAAAAEEGMPTMQQVAMEKVTAGITSIDEVLRTTPT